MASRRSYFDWHSWLGLTGGLMLFVICWSGTWAVFAYEIDWLLNPDIRAEAIEGPAPYAEAKAAVEQAHPEWRIWEINAPRYPGFAMEVLADSEPDVTQRVYVDPSTMTVLGDTSYFNVQRFFRSFHMALFQADFFSLLGVPIGYFVVAIFAFPLLASIITALVFYRRWWRDFFALRFGRGRRAFWSSAHKVAGVWSLWFVAIIGVSGVWYLAEWWLPYPPEVSAPAATSDASLPLDQLIETGERAFPELDVRSIYFADSGATVELSGHDGTVLTRGRASVTLDTTSGEAIDIYSQGGSGLLARLIETVDVLHFGTFAGLWSQALYFLFGIALSGLVLSGAYLHAKRLQKDRHVATRRASIYIAVTCTGSLLLMSTVAGWNEIKGYGSEDNWPEVAWPIALFIGTWVASVLATLAVWTKWVLTDSHLERHDVRPEMIRPSSALER